MEKTLNQIYKTRCWRECDGTQRSLQFNMNEINTGCRQSFHQPTHNDFNSFRLVFHGDWICHTKFGIEIQIFSHYSVNCLIKWWLTEKSRFKIQFNWEILCGAHLCIYPNLCVIKVFKIQKLNILQTNLNFQPILCQPMAWTSVTV